MHSHFTLHGKHIQKETEKLIWKNYYLEVSVNAPNCGAKRYCSHHCATLEVPCQDGIALPCTWLIKVPSPGGSITGDTHSRTPSGAGCCAWRLQHCLLQLLLPPRKYDPGKQNYSKTQQPTPCSHCSDVCIPHTRRMLGTICPSQLLHFPVSHPVLISAKARKPSVVELCELPEGQHSQV